jgi:hypothetical protein
MAMMAFALQALLLAPPSSWSQEQGQKPPRPPEIEKLLQLAKNPDKLREALTDPQRVQELMDLMESDAVREFARDPQRIMELMTEINPGQLRDAIQSIDPTIMRRAATARWMERLRKQLGATDEEWKVVGPRVEALLAAQQEARAGIRGFRAGGFGGPPAGGGGGRGFFGPGPQESSAVEEAAAAVREASQDPSVPDRDTALALREYRKARDRARERLATAERDLRELLTQRQEAILVTLGLLE